MSACCEAARLLASYKAALSAIDSAQGFSRLVPEHITVQEAAQVRQDAHDLLQRTRRRYWRHVKEHACRTVPVSRATNLPGVSGENCTSHSL